MQIANKCFLKYSVSLFIMEMHIKVTLGFPLTPGIITVINKVTEEEAGEDVGKKDIYSPFVGKQTSVTTMRIGVEVSQKLKQANEKLEI